MIETKHNPTPEFPGQYAYRFFEKPEGSEKFGLCEVCHKPCAPIYHQIESRCFEYEGELSWTGHRCRDLRASAKWSPRRQGSSGG